MKKPNMLLSIPKPCHESWSAMHPTEKGAFCNACSKQVIDFTTTTDSELISFLADSKNICGRFREDQIGRTLIQPRIKKSLWGWRTMLLGLLPLLGFRCSGPATMGKVATHQCDASDTSQKPATITTPSDTIKINGRVLNPAKQPLADAEVSIIDSAGLELIRGIKTDSLGFFSVHLHHELLTYHHPVMVVRHWDFMEKRIPLRTAAQQEYTVIFDSEKSALMGEVSIEYYNKHQKEH